MDVTVATLAYLKALEKGVGREFPFI